MHVPVGLLSTVRAPPDTPNYCHSLRTGQLPVRLSPYLILFRARRVRAVFFVLKHSFWYLALLLATAGRPPRWEVSSQNFAFSRLDSSRGTYNLFAMDTHLYSQQLCFMSPTAFTDFWTTTFSRDVTPRVGHSFIFPTALFFMSPTAFYCLLDNHTASRQVP